MQGRAIRASPLSIGLVVVIAAVSIVGFVYSKHDVDQQEQTILNSDASQAALYVSSVFSGIGSLLDTLGTTANLTNSSPSAFDSAAAPYGKAITSVLAHRQGDAYVVDAVSGQGFTAGQTLSPAISSVLASAGQKAVPGPVSFNGHRSTIGFAAGPPVAPPGHAVYMEFSLSPFVASQITAAKPFDSLKVALYGSSTPLSSTLVVATTSQLPLTGKTVTKKTTVGTGTWTLVASARERLTGSFASEAPYILLVLGLSLALVIGITVEVLDRRHRYAAEAVAARTADLNTSLEELRQTQTALVRSERLSALGEMASVVGHELRNPLAAVTNALYLLRRHLGEPAEPAIERQLAMAERETGKAAALAEDLTAFVRPRLPQREPVDARSFVEEVVETTPPPSDVELAVEIEPVTIVADRRQLAEVLSNLVTNAYQAVRDGGRVTIAIHPNGTGTVMSVEDTGPGIDAEVAERVFEPFFTTKHDGTGLGLAIVRRLVEGHGGHVAFEPPGAGTGARVVVHIPAAEETPTIVELSAV